MAAFQIQNLCIFRMLRMCMCDFVSPSERYSPR